MDPVRLEPLLYELRSPNAETVQISTENLAPGHVIADGEWARHVVNAPLQPLNETSTLVPVRHLHGGHNVKLRRSRTKTVKIFRHRLLRSEIGSIPVVPRCFVPDDPAIGDRILFTFHDVLRLGVGNAFEFNGVVWQRVSHGKTGMTVTPFRNIRAVVSDPSESSPHGWYSYQPAGHTPHLYVDGIPMPARTVDDLAVGDVMRLPGGGRLEVAALDPHLYSTTVTVRVLRPSLHPMRHFMWSTAVGGTGQHEDSGRTQSLYATESRPGDLVSAADIGLGDTVITSYGSPYSAVAVVDDVWRQPVRATMHVHSTGTDGRHYRTQTGLENRYVVLHRAAPAAPYKTTPDLIQVPA
ncbi:hypothetical protein [Streptomyces sp. NPDC059761]|uniref:hypothetical protein n=1 Tax=Streptomyces sp. NPDC059761 TaxID=3346937 RepID=UPI003663C744